MPSSPMRIMWTMALVIEGTTAGGYRCDTKGCSNSGVWTALVCIPYDNRPNTKENMFVGMVNLHLCNDCWRHVDADQLLGPKMRDLARFTANKSGARPAFERVHLAKWPVHSSEYINFQRAGGFVPPDDAKAKGEIVLPGLGRPLN